MRWRAGAGLDDLDVRARGDERRGVVVAQVVEAEPLGHPRDLGAGGAVDRPRRGGVAAVVSTEMPGGQPPIQAKTSKTRRMLRLGAPPS